MEAAIEPPLGPHEMQGRAEVRRVGRLRFPVYELVQDGVVLASMGRRGWIKVFFGRGQRIELADGSRWRQVALGSGGAICPAILDDGNRRIAISSVLEGGYGINGKTYGITLFPGEKKRLSPARRWIIRYYEDEIATMTRDPMAINAAAPLHVGGVLLAFTLARYGILGEWRPRFKLQWD